MTAGAITVSVRWYASRSVAEPIDGFAGGLDDRERRYVARLRQPADQWAYAAAHALIRRMLSARYGGPPRSWRFAKDDNDRPFLDGAVHGGLDPAFSISHTRGLAICALVDGGAAQSASMPIRVGVDAEARDISDIGERDIAERFFAPSEARFLATFASEKRRDAFLDLWTLKEAIAKAVGLGLDLSLSSYACRLDPPALETDEPALLPIDGWTLAMLDLGDRHAGALAVKHPPGRTIDLEYSAADSERDDL